MTIRFNCIHCIGKLEVESKGRGLTVSCPLCNQPVAIPDHVSILEKANKLMLASAEKMAKGKLYDYVAVGDLRDLLKSLGYRPCFGDEDTHHDFSSSTRLKLVLKMNVSFIRESSRWKMDQNQNVLDAFPAQELLRLESRRAPRDWTSRWIAAGGQLYNGFMIALKDDPIWTAISIFGTPWPPFDWGSGMGLRDVSRKAATDLGLLPPGERAGTNPCHPVIKHIMIEDDGLSDYLKQIESETEDQDDEAEPSDQPGA